MKMILGSATAALLMGLAIPAFADSTLVPCERDPRAAGMNERMSHMREQMDRIEWTVNRAQQRQLMELQTKKMHESLRELRKRELGEGCRLEVMQAMMEQMMRFHVVEQDSAAN